MHEYFAKAKVFLVELALFICFCSLLGKFVWWYIHQ
jgi:hypothetical protein